jgi:hypothetical protein
MTMARTERWAAIAAAVAAAGMAFGLVLSPARTWAGILMASFGLLGLELGGLFFVALNYASGGTWAVAIRRVPEAMSAAVPFGAAGLAIVFLVRPSIYPWMAGAERLSGFKGVWLDPPFFFSRAAIYVALWLAFAAAIVRTSRAQDGGRRPGLAARNAALSVAFIVVFALSFWLASFDWIMSLEPHWYSTIFGVYNFAGLFSSALAVLVLSVLGLRSTSALRGVVRDEHLHDLGKLLFAFSTFWMYIWFSQYMLIWYSNLPEEATYFVHRRTDLWLPLFYLNVMLNWVVPFVALLSKPAKRGPLLACAAVSVVAGRVLDLYLMVGPALSTGGPRFGIWELAPFVAACGLFVVVFSRAFRRAPPVPLGDPGLSTSLSYYS